VIFTKIDNLTLEKIDNPQEDYKREPIKQDSFIERSPIDGSYYAHLCCGAVIQCHNRPTAEFYIKSEKNISNNEQE
jgi:hypothetical protein